jgi:hypothetical protein
MPDHAAIARRRERLREELADAGARLDLARATDRAVIEELDYARFPPLHERRFPTCGAFVADATVGPPPAGVLSALGAIAVPCDAVALDDVRMLADGSQSFLARAEPVSELVLLPVPVPREPDVVRLRRSIGAHVVVITRDEAGTVRLYGRDCVLVWSGAQWWRKPYGEAYANRVLEAAPRAAAGLTATLLDFCVHDLGPARGGAILVWALDEAAAVLGPGAVPVGGPRALPSLSLADPRAHAAVRHLLAHVDGATLIGPAGHVLATGLHLFPSATARQHVHLVPERGTRHGAAQRFSHDAPGCIVFVVSSDGPVTVYVGGATVASIDMRNPTPPAAVRAAR